MPDRADYPCPKCHAKAKPIGVKCESWTTTVTIHCSACGHEWGIERDAQPLDFETTAK